MPIQWRIYDTVVSDSEHIMAKGDHVSFSKSWISRTYIKACSNEDQMHQLLITSEIDKEYKIGNSYYNQLYIYQILEELLEIQLLTKNQKRPLKKYWGKSVWFYFRQEQKTSTNYWDIYPIFIIQPAGKIWALAPVIKEEENEKS